MPATVLCRLCSRTASQQFTKLYYYVIRSTDVYGRFPRKSGKSEHAQSVYTRPSFMRDLTGPDEAKVAHAVFSHFT